MENVQHAAAVLLPSPLHRTLPSSPDHLPVGPAAALARRGIKWSGRREEELPGAWAVEKPPHPLHQYCNLTWWKLTPANIFHHVIGREYQMPWPDMPTLLPIQMMTQGWLHYSWLVWRRRGSLKATESRGCSRVQLSTSVSELKWTRAPPAANGPAGSLWP